MNNFSMIFLHIFHQNSDRKRIREVKVGNEDIVVAEVGVVVVVLARNVEDIVVKRDMSEKERQEKKKWKESVYVKLL